MKDWIYDHIRVRSLVLLAIALGALSMMTDAHAGTITTTVKPPILYTDGTKIDQPIKYRLEGSYDGQATIVVTSDSPKFVMGSMPAGHWCNRVYSVVDGVDGDPSDESCVTVPSATPPPPPTVKKPNPAYGITTIATP